MLLQKTVKSLGYCLLLLAWSLEGVYVWTWRPPLRLRAACGPTGAGASKARLFLLAFSPDSRTLAVQQWQPRGRLSVELWDVAAGRLRARIDPVERVDFTEPVFSPASRLLAAPQGGQTILWDTATGQPRVRLDDAARQFGFSPDGKWLAGRSPRNADLKLWDVSTGREHALVAPGRSWYSRPTYRFSPDSRFLAFADDPKGRVRLWDIAAGRERAGLPGNLPALAFAPDGRTAAVGDGTQIAVCDVASGRVQTRLPTGAVGALGFSPDGKSLVTLSGTRSGWISVWDVAGGRERAAMKGPPYTPQAEFLFRPGDSWLGIQAAIVTGSSSLWDLRARPPRLLYESDGQAGSSFTRARNEYNLAFTPDGETVVLKDMHPPFQGPRNKWEAWWQQFKARLPWLFGQRTARDMRGRLEIVDTGTRGVVATLDNCGAWLLAPDGKTLASQAWTGPSQFDRVQLWDVPSRLPLGWRLGLSALPLLPLTVGAWYYRARRTRAKARADGLADASAPRP